MIYLDNAATSFPKPDTVQSEVLRCITEYCGNPGRASHRLAADAASKIYECRDAVSELFGLGLPENVFFTQNATHALNTVIKGVIRDGDHVIISDMEHNSVFRPVYRLAKDKRISFDVFKTHPTSEIIHRIERLIRPNTRLIVCTHCPNISSCVLPIRDIGELCQRKKIVFAVDAAQSAGHIPIDMREMKIDALCIPGHKGLYGIQGCGAVCLREGLVLDTLTEGGSGVNSLDGDMPSLSPERYEAGTPPTPSIASLCEGIREIRRIGIESIASNEKRLYRYACASLERIRGVRIYEKEHEGGVLLFNIDGIPSDAIASSLGRLDVCVRGGYHCAYLGHSTLNTLRGGAVRLSFGIFNCFEDVDVLCERLAHILKNRAYTE